MATIDIGSNPVATKISSFMDQTCEIAALLETGRARLYELVEDRGSVREPDKEPRSRLDLLAINLRNLRDLADEVVCLINEATNRIG